MAISTERTYRGDVKSVFQTYPAPGKELVAIVAPMTETSSLIVLTPGVRRAEISPSRITIETPRGPLDFLYRGQPTPGEIAKVHVYHRSPNSLTRTRLIFTRNPQDHNKLPPIA